MTIALHIKMFPVLLLKVYVSPKWILISFNSYESLGDEIPYVKTWIKVTSDNEFVFRFEKCYFQSMFWMPRSAQVCCHVTLWRQECVTCLWEETPTWRWTLAEPNGVKWASDVLLYIVAIGCRHQQHLFANYMVFYRCQVKEKTKISLPRLGRRCMRLS